MAGHTHTVAEVVWWGFVQSVITRPVVAWTHLSL